MKIQSSLLVLAAMVGSATAANKRKRVFKIYSREEIQAAEQVTRSLEKDQGKDKKEAEPVLISAAMSMETAMSMPTPETLDMCAFCAEGLTNPSLDLGVQGQTCGSVSMAASRLDATDANCALAKQAEFLCCPPVMDKAPATTTAATTTAMAMSMPVATAPAMSMPTATVTGEIADAPVYEETGDSVVEEDVVETEKELPPAEEPADILSGAMTLETTLAALTVAGAVMLL